MQTITDEKTVSEYRNTYYREWRARNRERIKATNKKYWQKYAEKKRNENKEMVK